MGIKKQLRQAIINSGLSHNQLWKESGVRQQVISRFVSGERGLTLSSAERLCNYFQLELAPIEPPAKPAKKQRKPRKGGAK